MRGWAQDVRGSWNLEMWVLGVRITKLSGHEIQDNPELWTQGLLGGQGLEWRTFGVSGHGTVGV